MEQSSMKADADQLMASCWRRREYLLTSFDG